MIPIEYRVYPIDMSKYTSLIALKKTKTNKKKISFVLSTITVSHLLRPKNKTKIRSSQASFLLGDTQTQQYDDTWFTLNWKAVKHGLTHSFINVCVMHTVAFSHCASFKQKFEKKQKVTIICFQYSLTCGVFHKAGLLTI